MPGVRKTPWLGKEPNQKAWYIYWFETARRTKRRSTRTSNRSEAEKQLAEFILEYADKEKRGPVAIPENYPVATALRWYLQEHGPDLANADIAARTVENLIEFFGVETMVSHLTPQVLKRYGRERTRKKRVYQTKEGIKEVADTRPITQATIRRELVVLVASLNHAIVNGRLTSAPQIPLPAMGQPKMRYLEPEEIEQLLNNCPEAHVRLFIKLGITTGARKGALLELKWEQIDFTNRILYLNPAGRDQTKKRRAIVPINDQLYRDLVATKKEQEDFARRQSEKEVRMISPCGHVIAYKYKQVKNIRKGFDRSCERAGIEGATPHTLRHTAGTLMALAGVDLFRIARLLGHSVQKTTELYAHLHPNYLRDAIDVLEAATYQGQLLRVADSRENMSSVVH